MSSTHGTLIVALEENVSDEYVEDLMVAIRTMRGVAGVTAEQNNMEVWTAKSQLASEWYRKIHETLRELMG